MDRSTMVYIHKYIKTLSFLSHIVRGMHFGLSAWQILRMGSVEDAMISYNCIFGCDYLILYYWLFEPGLMVGYIYIPIALLHQIF